MSRNVPMINSRAPPNSRATNWSKARDGWSARCRSSKTSTKGWRCDAVLRKAAMESNKRNRACSGSSWGDGGRLGSLSLTSETTSAISAAPEPISDCSCWGSFSLTQVRMACTQGQ